MTDPLLAAWLVLVHIFAAVGAAVVVYVIVAMLASRDGSQ